jgi:4-hydroxythreonine-4-phosphate dehydrogenase
MDKSENLPRIALTPGEPSGIGPDLCLQLLQKQQACELILVASPNLLEKRAEQLKLPVTITEFDPDKPERVHRKGVCCVSPVEMAIRSKTGVLNRSNSSYVLKTISRATKGCINGVFDAMVTGPVHKGVINDAGFDFSGHTEFIAGFTGGHPVMMLATQGLRVALVTTHLPLAQVSLAITHSRLRKVIRVLHQSLQSQFAIKSPHILVCGLNPHAGEGGHLGREEIDIIEPVLEGMRKQGLNLQGPVPADTAFTPKYLQSTDAVLAMYHDQGLPVLKYLGFGRAANITLGLPIIRTSVDHGTALELAGTGEGEIGSLEFAIKTALEMVEKK